MSPCFVKRVLCLGVLVCTIVYTISLSVLRAWIACVVFLYYVSSVWQCIVVCKRVCHDRRVWLEKKKRKGSAFLHVDTAAQIILFVFLCVF